MSLAFLVYEYLITLEREVELFWKGGSTSATALFAVNRYLTLGLRVANLMGFVPMSDEASIYYSVCG